MQALGEILVDQDIYRHPLVRETLLEHVGHLPIMAAYLYPHLEQADKVDLGHILAMLAIHDIGETVTGDIHAYDKTPSNEHSETEVVRQLLNINQFSYYEEYQAAKTLPAKFAKAS